MKRVMCLSMPSLAVEHRLRQSGRPAHEPFALVDRYESRERVRYCNAAAREGGVRAGMPLAEARAVLPCLKTAPYEPRADTEILRSLAEWANCLSPTVQADPPDSLLLDVTGCERLFRGESNLLRLGVRGLAAQGLTAHGAIADTVGAAWAVAHGADAAQVVPPGQVAAALAPLPPWTLRIEPSEAATLEAVGIHKIETLLHLPRASVAARLGPNVVRRLNQALGIEPEPIVPHRPPAEPMSRLRFGGPTDRLDVLNEAADRLLSFFCAQLMRRAAGVRRMLCTLYHEDAAPTTLEIAMSRASRSEKHLRSLLRSRLEESRLSAPVFAMMLWTRSTERLDDAQGALFEPARDAGDEGIAGLVDRLANRLGVGAVVRPEVLDDHQPEYAYRYVSALDETPRPAHEAAGVRSREGEPRPLRLLARPVEVPAMSVVPDGPPTWFRWGGREHSIAWAVGPERIETGWWREQDVQRDYYAVCSQAGRRFWLFRDRTTGKWFVQGSFE